jgi:hypothetical protein
MGANMMLTIGAILLFGTFLSSSNKLMIGNNQIAAQNEYYIAGLSIAQSVIDEAKTKAFDQNTFNASAVVPLTSMTAAASLGKEAGETMPAWDTLSWGGPYSANYKGYWSALRFNDVDDYKDYRRLVNTPRAEGYRVIVNVNYANASSPDNSSAVRTYCKKMTVKVTSPFFRSKYETQNNQQDTITVFYAFTY